MKRTFMIAAIAACCLSVSPSQAQHLAADLLPPQEVGSIVVSMGLRPIDRPLWRNGRYVVHAVDRYGREMRVVLDARDGEVLAVRPAGPRLGYNPPPMGEPRYGGDPRYVPPPSPPRDLDQRFEDGVRRPPYVAPGAPPPDDDEDEFFDDERQQGSLSPDDEDDAPRISPPRTTMVHPPARDTTQSTPSTARRSADTERKQAKDPAPLPRARPALANAQEQPAEPKKEVRMIDLSKPKPAAPVDQLPH